jgi:hypothetical protein
MSGSVLLGRATLDPSADYRYVLEPRKEPEHPSSRLLLDYWRRCEKRGGMRMGRDIPHRALAKVLAYVAVTEPVNGWRDGYMRLVGSGLTDRFGRDITGVLISELFVYDDPQMYALMMGGAKAAATERRPGFALDRILLHGKEVMRNEVVVLPVQAPDSDAMWALTGTFRF